MAHRLTKVFFTSAILGLSPALALADGTTLRGAMIGAYQSSKELAIERATLRQIDEGVVAARSALEPSVNANGSLSTTRDLRNSSGSNSASVSISANQLIYDAGRTQLGVDAARMGVLESRQNLVDTEQSVLLNAVIAFMDVRRDRDQVNLAQNNVRVLREQVRASQDRFEVGEITRTDVAQTEARLAQAISNLEVAKGDLRISEQGYIATIGTSPGRLHAVSSLPGLPASANLAEALAVSSHPRIIAAQFAVKQAQAELDATNLNKKLRVTGSLSAGASSNSAAPVGESLSVTGALQATLPIYQGGLYDSQRRSAIAALERAQAAVRLNTELTRRAVNQAYANWQSSRAAKQAVRSQIEAAEIAFEGVQEEANFGQRTTLDVLNAEQELLAARSNLISASRNEIVAVYGVLAEIGSLTVEKQGLGIATYDPDVNYSKVTTPSRLGQKRNDLLDKLLNR